MMEVRSLSLCKSIKKDPRHQLRVSKLQPTKDTNWSKIFQVASQAKLC